MIKLIEKRPVIQKFLNQNFDHVVVSVSGGKDSSVLMQYALDNFPLEKIVCLHAVIDIDHKETKDTVRKQCDFFNMPLKFVKSVNKDGDEQDFLDILVRPRIDRKTGEKKENQFPSMSSRWCTKALKTGPCDKFCRTLKGKVLVLVGERAEESAQRAALEAIRPDEDNSKPGRTVIKFSPLLEMSEREVWSIINTNMIPVHPCYSQGFSRASCAICVFSTDKEIALAAKHQPEIVAEYIKAERKISHTFKYKPATKTREAIKETIYDILKKQDALKYVEALIA